MLPREKKLQQRMAEVVDSIEDPLEKITVTCLAKGYSGLLTLVRLFRGRDPKNSWTLPQREIMDIFKEFGVDLSEDQLKTLFEQFEVTAQGEYNYDELLDAIRPPMSDPRKEIVAIAFNSLDDSEDGLVSIDDLRSRYCPSQHPSVLSGNQTEEEVLKRFIGRFQNSIGKDKMMTKAEFFDYYTAVSKSIDDDDSFVQMIRSVWGVGL